MLQGTFFCRVGNCHLGLTVSLKRNVVKPQPLLMGFFSSSYAVLLDPSCRFCRSASASTPKRITLFMFCVYTWSHFDASKVTLQPLPSSVNSGLLDFRVARPTSINGEVGLHPHAIRPLPVPPPGHQLRPRLPRQEP